MARTDWVRRSDELTHRMLLIHSEDDEFVPVGPSAALAAKRPDLVTYEPWRHARHTKEWNVDRRPVGRRRSGRSWRRPDPGARPAPEQAALALDQQERGAGRPRPGDRR